MANPQNVEKEDESDYGSDLDADQEDFVNQVLRARPEVPESSPSLLLRDIEDNEGPHGAKIPSTMGKNGFKQPRSTDTGHGHPITVYRSEKAQFKCSGYTKSMSLPVTVDFAD